MGRLKDFFFGRQEELKEPETGNTHTVDDTEEEQAAAVPYTNRHPWGDFSLLQRLTPERLVEILNLIRPGLFRYSQDSPCFYMNMPIYE
jgi:hypothetical protein